MKRKAPGNPKFEDFQEALELRRYQAVGLLELLWHFTAEYAPDGAVGRYPNRRIARKLEYEGNADELVRVLVQTHWLDTNVVDPLADEMREPARLFVHAWPEHCEDNVHRSLARARSLFANGQLPKTTRLGPNERSQVENDLARLFPEHVRTRDARNAPHHGHGHGHGLLKKQSGQLPTAEHDVRTSSRARKLPNVGEDALSYERPLLALYERAAAGGYLLSTNAAGVLLPRAASTATKQAFFTLAHYAMNAPRIRDRAAYFVDCLAKGRWTGGPGDEAWAIDRLKVLEGDPLEGVEAAVAEALGSSTSTPESPRAARSTADEGVPAIQRIASGTLKTRADEGDAEARAELDRRSAISRGARRPVANA